VLCKFNIFGNYSYKHFISINIPGKEGITLKGVPSQVLNDGREITLSGDIQDLPGRGPVQPAVGDSASAGGLD